MITGAGYSVGDYSVSVSRYVFQNANCCICNSNVCHTYIINYDIAKYLCIDCTSKNNLALENVEKRKNAFLLMKMKGLI